MDNPFDKTNRDKENLFRKEQLSEEDRLRLKHGNWPAVPTEEKTDTVLWGNEEQKTSFTKTESTKEPEAPKVGPEVERMNKKNAILASYEGLESNIPASSDYWKL